jgi:L-2-hydroxyglutarate oxidase
MQYDIVVIGGGIVGLATALQLKNSNPSLKLLVIEKEDILAKHQTGNNSGVIHSGLYYKPGSLKATNCIHGYRLLLDFCNRNEIPYELCGKIVVATSQEEIPLLNNLYVRGQQNGLQNLKKLSQGELKEYEPHVAGIEGIFVPQTGIVNYTVVANKYGDLIKKAGGEIHLGEKVIGIEKKAGEAVVITQKTSYPTKLVVNCGVLYSD